MAHDEACELTAIRNTCKCAIRAYERDPMLDEDGAPIALGKRHGTAAPLDVHAALP